MGHKKIYVQVEFSLVLLWREFSLSQVFIDAFVISQTDMEIYRILINNRDRYSDQ